VARADQVALRVALLPLLKRTVVVDSFQIEGAQVRLVRDADGVSLPGAKPAARRPDAPPQEKPAPAGQAEAGASSAPEAGRGAPPAAGGPTGEGSPPAEGPGEPAGEAPAFDLAVRSVDLIDATLVFEDRVVSPPQTHRVKHIDATLSVAALDQPIPFDVRASLESGGTLGAGGTATLDGDLDLSLELSEVRLAAFEPYLGESLSVQGSLSGSVQVRGPVAGNASVHADLRIADSRIRSGEIEIDGPVSIKAGLDGGFEKPQGRFDVDATESTLRLGGSFQKPPGKPATVSGRIVTGPEGLAAIEDVDLQVGNAKARARVLLEPKTRVVAKIEPFDLTGWDEMVPALAGLHPAGRVRSDEITFTAEPRDLRGKVYLDTVMVEIPDHGLARATGSIEARGDAIQSRDLAVVAADQTISVEASLSNLWKTPRYRVTTRSQDVDSNRLVSSLTSRRDTFFGPLDFDGEFSGVLGDDAPLAGLHGLARFDVTNGRIVGLSLLHSLFNQLGEIGATLGLASNLALGAAPLFTGKDLQRYYGDEFELLAGSLQLADGVASTEDLRLVYRDYSVDLRGRFDLGTSKFKLVADLTLGKKLDETLAGGKVDATKPPLVIPFPIQGRLDSGFAVGTNPTLSPDREVLAGLVRRYALDRHRDEAAKALDGVLGKKGSGKEVVDILEGILGGGSKPKAKTQPAPQDGPAAEPPATTR